MHGGGARDYAGTLGAPLRVVWRASQLLVLRDVAGAQGATPGQVAQRLQFSHATITAIVDRLVAGKLDLAICYAVPKLPEIRVLASIQPS